MHVLIHHSEIIIKGKNRSFFETKLVSNIKNSFKNIKLIKDMGRIICETTEDINKFKKICGIKYYAQVKIFKKEELFKEIEKILKNLDVKTLAPITKRSDKRFELNSVQISSKIGELANSFGIKIDFKSENKIYTEITKDNCYVYTTKLAGYGGLPVSSSGKVLCLLSGGIDSPVAAWMMMKRGCKVDFLHFHTFKTNQEVKSTKIEKLVKLLNEYQGSSKLYSVPYHLYQFENLHTKQNIDLVLFKNFILRIAQEVAKQKGYKAIITGDSVGQVASQTLQNLETTSYGINQLIFRPLIGFNKDEIISLAQEIGVYEESIREYKDCCSILSKKPLTHAKIEELKSAFEKIDLSKLIKESLESLESFQID